MKIKAMIVLVLAAMFSAVGLQAQTATISGVDMASMDMTSPSTLIRGNETPDQIPQQVIFRMWLAASTQDGKISGADKIGFANPNDTLLVQTAQLTYVKKQRPADAAYNATVGGDNFNSRNAYWASHYGLVGNLLGGLQSHLSADGLTKFDAFLENLKAGAFVSPVDYGLGTIAETRIKELNMYAGNPQGPSGMTPSYGILFQQSTTFPAATNSDPMVNGFNGHWVGVAGSFGSYSGGAYVINGFAVSYFNIKTGNDQCNSVTLAGLPGVGQFLGVGNRLSTDGTKGNILGFYNWGNGVYGLAAETGTSGGWAHIPNSYSYTYSMAVGDVLTACSTGSVTVYYLTGTATGGVRTAVTSSQDDNLKSGYAGIVGSGGNGVIKNFVSQNGELYTINGSLTGDTICTGTVCNNVVHTPSVHLKIGTLGSIVTGPGRSPQTSVGVYNNQVFNMDDIFLDPYSSYDLEGEVLCSASGLFFAGFTDAPGGGGSSPITWTPCPTGGCSAGVFWTAMTVTRLSPPVQAGPNLTVIINCTKNTSPPDYVPTSTAVQDWGTSPNNWVFYGWCYAPIVGRHRGFYYCTPSPILTASGFNPLPAWWLQWTPDTGNGVGWGPFFCTYDGYTPTPF